MKSPSAEERLEEARKKAREVVQRIVDSRNPGEAVWVQNSIVDSIAQALLEAERKGMERGAKIALDKKVDAELSMSSGDEGYNAACDEIAEEIRSRAAGESNG